jgi:hypothetical protein
LIIDFGDVPPQDDAVDPNHWSEAMTTIYRMITASAVAFSTLALLTLTGPSAQAETMARSGTYCLSYGQGGTDCSFTSYAQCEATASGQTAECYGPPPVQDFRRDRRPAHETGTSHF